jgi:hypothetical protein
LAGKFLTGDTWKASGDAPVLGTDIDNNFSLPTVTNYDTNYSVS